MNESASDCGGLIKMFIETLVVHVKLVGVEDRV